MTTGKTSYFILSLPIILLVTASPLPNNRNDAAKEIQRLQYKVRYLTHELLKCRYEDKLDLHLRWFQNKNVTCNDGTPAGYYIKRSYNSKKWIVYLEGGWYCFNDQLCTLRMNTPGLSSLTSSKDWFSKKRGYGILSPSAAENPTWYNANHVLLPYCSSDAWSGNVSRFQSGGQFSFMGYRIVSELIKELLLQGLFGATDLLMAGSSAGGIGVIMNIDRVAEMISTAGSSCKVRGITDSGWYTESKPDLVKCKIDPSNCKKPSQAIKQGMSYWNGVVPKSCAKEFQNDPWRCYFGHNIYRTLKSPLFIFQWQYDPSQIMVDDPSLLYRISDAIFGQHLMSKIMKIAKDLKTSLFKSRIRAVFLPSCLGHSTLMNSDWLSVQVKGYNLDQAINCWISQDTQRSRNDSTISPNTASAHCTSILVDDCTLPQCNHRCPTPRNPFTGELLVTPTLSLGMPGVQNDK